MQASSWFAGLALGCTLCAVIGCGGSDTPPSAVGAACDKAGATGDSSETLEVAGATRSYFVHVPAAAAGKSVALVLAFHGDGGNGEQLAKSLKLDEITGDEAIVVYPTAQGGSFDLDTQEGNADVAFFDAIVEKVSAEHCVAKTFALGFSRGAYFTNHLACYRGSKLDAIAAHAGGGPYSAPYANGELQCPDQPTAAMIVHGLDDKTVAPSEADKSIAQWSRTLQCKAGTEAVDPEPCVRHQGCSAPLVECKVPGLGHSIWEQGLQASWDFFKTR